VPLRTKARVARTEWLQHGDGGRWASMTACLPIARSALALLGGGASALPRALPLWADTWAKW